MLLAGSEKIHFSDKVDPSDGNGFCPDKLDVICGRDKKAFNHFGNVRYRTIVDMYRGRYQSAKSREEKTRIADDIIDFILQSGNFVKYDRNRNLWYVVSTQFAHGKVAHALRSIKQVLVGKKLLLATRKSEKEEANRKTPPEEDAALPQGSIRDENLEEEFDIDFSIIDEIGRDPAFASDLLWSQIDS